MARVKLHSARTTLPNADAAAEDLCRQLGGVTAPRLAVLFASRDRDQRALNHAIRSRLPSGTRLVGATTAGEIDNHGIHRGAVVLALLDGDVEVGLGLGTNLGGDAFAAGGQAIAGACRELGVHPADLDPRRYVAMVIDDGFREKKEEFLLGILDRNQGLVLVGGGASDHEQDPARQSAEIHVDGEVVTNGVLVALFRTDAPWAALRSHWYDPTGERLTITKVDDTHRRVIEIDGRPAAQRYSELIGVPIAELPFGMPRGFSDRPTALKVGREYFIRAAGWPLPDGSIVFANVLEEGSELELMKMGDMVAVTRRFFVEELPRRVHSPSAALFFHCGARAWVAATGGQLGNLSETFSLAPPCAGLNVQFETYCGFHINTTLTTLAFGAGE